MAEGDDSTVVTKEPSDFTKEPSDLSVPESVQTIIDKFMIIDSDLEASKLSIQLAVDAEAISVLQAELEEIEKLRETFDATYLEVLSACRKENISLVRLDERRSNFLSLFKQLKAAIFKVLRPPPNPSTSNSSKPDTVSGLKLSKIEVPVFSGIPSEWSQWKAMYETFIHSRGNYKAFEKHQILRSKLKGEPYTLIEEIPLDENDSQSYDNAWQVLLDHYDDPLESVSRYLRALDTLQPKSSLKTLVTHYRANVTPLKIVFSKCPDIDIFSQFIIHSFLQKADKGSNLDWQRELQRKAVLPTFDDFLKYMQGRCKSFERANNSNQVGSASSSAPSKGRTLVSTGKSSFKVNCAYCRREGHLLHKCSDFAKLSVEERFGFVKKKQMCRKCLRSSCNRLCKIFCNQCKKDHNTLIHINFQSRGGKRKEETDSSNQSEQSGKFFTSSSYSSNSMAIAPKNIDTIVPKNIDTFSLLHSGWVGSLVTDDLYALLATALVEIQIPSSNNYSTRAILDNASQFNFISTSTFKKLNLVSKSVNYTVKGIDSMSSSLRGLVTLSIKSMYSNFQIVADFLIVDCIVDLVPSEHFSIDNWQFPLHLKLADPKFNVPQSVDLLLGLGIFWKIIKPNFKFLGTGLPNMIATHFGWLVAGEIQVSSFNKKYQQYNFLISDDMLSDTIEKLWFLEETASDNKSSVAIEIEIFFLKNTTRNNTGRFVTRLPFLKPHTELGNSRNLAIKRFYWLENKLLKNAELHSRYTDCLNDYLKQGHMKELVHDNGEGYYLSHHGILKEGSTSTTLRVVFNASMLTTTKLSLNNCLMIGPRVQSDLISILIRSRTYKYIISADIVQMYRQFLIHEEDTKFQKIFWRSSPDKPLKVYELVTVTFGVASAPFLATRCLNQLAEDYGENYPLAKSAILRDFYVDDVFSGTNTLSTAIKLQEELTTLLASAGLELNKWCSNDDLILNMIPAEKHGKKFPLYFGNEHAIKTLGLIWIPKDDVFKIWVHCKNIANPSKRQVLSIISSMFDPLGFLGPTTILAKLLMQQLWVANNNKLSWDDCLPSDLLQSWNDFSSQLSTLNNLSIPRLALQFGSNIIYELHGFCDATERAYGAVIYLKSIQHDTTSVRLLCSKTRVAPLKSTKRSIAQLELCAAVLLAELYEKVSQALTNIIELKIVRLWCDNTTTLYWIHSNPNRWIVFVANRTRKIQGLSSNAIWDYVTSENNAADILSRGMLPNLLQSENSWWNGPSWLQSGQPFTSVTSFKPTIIPRNCEGKNTKNLFCATIVRSFFFEKFSELNKLIRTVAWYYRFFMYLDYMGPFLTGPLQCFEVRNATTVLVKLVQQESFPDEIKCIQKGRSVDAKSKLAALSPFMDSLGVIRVGGRLRESNLSFDQRFPIVLPSSHPFTALLVRHEHKINCHAGPNLLGFTLHRKWWILSQNRAIQSCILKCISCVRMKATTRNQFMSNLPKARVTPHRPFSICGLDFTGPIQLLKWKGCRNGIKAYICLFVCFSTKAIHLELVTELTTECFLAALRRFISRRGIPLEIHSDNATTFVGAARHLKDLKTFLTTHNNYVVNFATDLNINWHFIPPNGPHFGGLWEAGIKSVKTAIQTSLKNTKFTYEHYLTYLLQIEACLNSRPLTLESTDPNEPRALTPGHFLIGGPITGLPNPHLTTVPINRIKYWEQIQLRTQFFWKKWQHEYLNTLQQRSKWRQIKNNVKIGDIVLIIEDNTPPTHWPLAKIISLHPNKDGLVRKVSLRVCVGGKENLSNTKKSIKTTELIRPVTKLVYLPVE